MGGWKWWQRGLSHTNRNFRERGNVFLNEGWLQSCSPAPTPHLASVMGDVVKGSEAKCINQGSVLILSPLLVVCIRRLWLCQQHNVRTRLPKFASHSNALLFVTCPVCAYGPLMTMSRGLLRCPAAGAATGAGVGEMPRGGRWVEHHPPCTMFSTPVNWSNAAGNGYCVMRGFFFILFGLTKETPAARAVSLVDALRYQYVFTVLVGQLKQQRVFKHAEVFTSGV